LVGTAVSLTLSGAVLAAAPGAGPELDPAPPAAAVGDPTPYRDGPPIGFAGGFGEDTCQACHFDGEVNEAAGTVTIEGVPARFVPGESYTLQVSLTTPDLVVGGFMLTVRDGGSGAQAGALSPVPGHEEEVAISVDSESGVHYAHHRVGSSIAQDGGALHWAVTWSAPDRASGVLIHVSALAADGDDSASGDFVFTTATGTSPP
jgi:hypothetical protein